jgi:hypothetical protein
VPFEGSFSEVDLDFTETPDIDNFKTTNATLQEVIQDEAKFCELYEALPYFIKLTKNITSQARNEFESSNRIGSVETMIADLAALYL